MGGLEAGRRPEVYRAVGPFVKFSVFPTRKILFHGGIIYLSVRWITTEQVEQRWKCHFLPFRIFDRPTDDQTAANQQTDLRVYITFTLQITAKHNILTCRRKHILAIVPLSVVQ